MKNIKAYFKDMFYSLLAASLRAAASEQGLNGLIARLKTIVPDISEQYSGFKIDNAYLDRKARNMHAFQISLVGKVIEEFQSPAVVDIGDSAGTHLQYIIGLYSKSRNIKTLSVNMDSKAVEKIKSKGLNALKARAEDLHDYRRDADIFLCFEMLEHLQDPVRFMHELSSRTSAKYLIITVPYLAKSRVGLHHIRGGRHDEVNAENTHIFELNPKDWKLLARHSGWNVINEKTYFQYPRRGPLGVLKPLWRRFDFEGFYGLVLKRDDAWSSKYPDW